MECWGGAEPITICRITKNSGQNKLQFLWRHMVVVHRWSGLQRWSGLLFFLVGGLRKISDGKGTVRQFCE